LTRDSGRRRHRDEMEKSIQAKHREDQAEKKPTDVREYFHDLTMAPPW
jgi:hypothetical protein